MHDAPQVCQIIKKKDCTQLCCYVLAIEKKECTQLCCYVLAIEKKECTQFCCYVLAVEKKDCTQLCCYLFAVEKKDCTQFCCYVFAIAKKECTQFWCYFLAVSLIRLQNRGFFVFCFSRVVCFLFFLFLGCVWVGCQFGTVTENLILHGMLLSLIHI
eukprot:TRINITY_DN16735_c0_g1_i2.p1 TRINITY_DN16735_c0_g1~~TRINITY_DN16735_c0_g1_i2.p1  ORF type:complete len:157 (+),score=22.99 TRINITY_DN16735_c0_g1_i2:24-494(+)